MINEHPCFTRRPSSRTRVFRVLESLSLSDSFLSKKLIVTGATHVNNYVFVKSCEEHGAHIHLKNKNTTPWVLKFLPIPRPINFVVSLKDQRKLVSFIRAIDEYLIAKVFFVNEDDSNAIIDSLCNSGLPVSEERLTIKPNYFIYGFDFDFQDPINPVEELYSYSSISNDLRLFFE